MNFELAKEIYGKTWFTDIYSINVLSNILANANKLDPPEQKLNSCFLYKPESQVTIVYDEDGLSNDEEFDAVGIIDINGPITVNGGISSFGMKQLSQRMRRMAKDSRVKSFVIRADSGGGSSAAVEIMTNTINQIRKEDKKRVDAVILEGGMAASACFGILTACDNIFSESEMNMVGSAGTMIEFMGRPANVEGPDGYKNIRIYATKSTEKNIEFEEALTNNNFKPIIDNLLDPVNERFLNLMLTNRPKLKGTNFDNGNIQFSKDVIGTYIDGIKSFSQVIEGVVKEPEVLSIQKPKEESTQGNTPIINNKSNKNKSNKMTADQLKQEHPEIYNQVFNAGVAHEKDRVGSWMVHVDTDSKAVAEGIKSGENISMTQAQEFLVKQTAKQLSDGLVNGSAPAVPTTPSGETDDPNTETAEVAAMYGQVDKKLKQ